MPDDPQTLIITGASSGIGRALALAAARNRYRVVIVARRAARLDEVASSIRSAGGDCAALSGDITATGMPQRIVDTALGRFGRIDVLVNNAGGGDYGGLLEQSDAAWEAQWQTHVVAPLRIARAALPHLRATRGQLVFVGSGVVRVPLPNQGAYGLAKAAIRAAATQLRRELRSQGVAVSYVDPGVVATEFHSRLTIDRPPGVIASPERVARAILRGIRRRRAVINAVPWQTAFSTLGEWAGTLADPIVTGLYGVRRSAAPSPAQQPEPVDSASINSSLPTAAGETPSFDKALEPVARRMERVKLPANFLRDALVPDATLELPALAMRWAGMPNKNERAALREALDALASAGYVEPIGEETWRVVRAAE